MKFKQMKNNDAQGPLMVSFDVTYKCTLRCKHCYNYSGEHQFDKKELTDEELLDVAKSIANIKPSVVCICGGEPLVRKKIVFAACKLIKEINPEITLNMVTNGELLTAEDAQMIKDIGFSFVQISLDGAKAETHDWLRNKKGAFKSAIKAITLLVQNGITVGVSCAPTKRNINEYEDLIHLCEEYKVSELRIQPLMLLGRAKNNLKDELLDYKDYRKIYSLIDKYEDSNVYIEWGDPIDHLIRSKYMKELLVYIGISAYGDILPSQYLPISVGNVKRHSLDFYWNHGLKRAWSMPLLQKIVDLIISPSEMSIDEFTTLPEIFTGKELDLDVTYSNIEEINNNLIDKYHL